MPPVFDRICAFDLETTGVDVRTARIVTSSAVLMCQSTGEHEEITALANPGIPIDPGASAVHGFTDDYVAQHGLPHSEVLAQTTSLLNQAWGHGVPVVAFNAAFDLSILKAQDPEFQIRGLVIDPHVIDKAADRYRRGSRKLIDVAAHYGVELSEDDAHGSGADARAAGEITWRLFDQADPSNVLHRLQIDPSAPDAAASLMGLQAHHRRQSQASLAHYLKDAGKIESVDEVDGGWPFQDCLSAPEVVA